MIKPDFRAWRMLIMGSDPGKTPENPGKPPLDRQEHRREPAGEEKKGV
jgi:hypothetical protein